MNNTDRPKHRVLSAEFSYNHVPEDQPKSCDTQSCAEKIVRLSLGKSSLLAGCSVFIGSFPINNHNATTHNTVCALYMFVVLFEQRHVKSPSKVLLRILGETLSWPLRICRHKPDEWSQVAREFDLALQVNRLVVQRLISAHASAREVASVKHMLVQKRKKLISEHPVMHVFVSVESFRAFIRILISPSAHFLISFGFFVLPSRVFVCFSKCSLEKIKAIVVETSELKTRPLVQREMSVCLKVRTTQQELIDIRDLCTKWWAAVSMCHTCFSLNKLCE